DVIRSPLVTGVQTCALPICAVPHGQSKPPGASLQRARSSSMSATSLAEKWVDDTAGMTRPSNVVWCDGSKAEYDRLIEEMLRDRSDERRVGTEWSRGSGEYP